MDPTMEYSADGVNWIPVHADKIDGMKPGTYMVRVRATDNVPHGLSAEVTVGVKDELVLSESQKPTVKSGITYNGPEPVDPGDDDFEFYWLDTLPKTGFSSASPMLLPEKPMELNYEPLRRTLEIPSASIAAEIVSVPFEDGEYPVTWLGAEAGLLEGSALPGEGQSLVIGHNHLNTNEAGPFFLLKWVIFIRDERGGVRTFVVYANVKAAEDDINAVNRLISEDPLSLTLITCEDEREGGRIRKSPYYRGQTAVIH